MFEVLVNIFAIIGVLSVAMMLANVIKKNREQINNFMYKFIKKPFFCNHEYVILRSYEKSDRVDCILKCRRCGKRERITIYFEK